METYQDGIAAIGDPTRRAIFELLAGGPAGGSPVGELAARLPVSRPAVSQHLRVLRAAGLVRDHPAGTRRLYRLDPEGVAAMRAYLDRFWDQALADFKTTVENPDNRENPGNPGNPVENSLENPLAQPAGAADTEENRP